MSVLDNIQAGKYKNQLEYPDFTQKKDPRYKHKIAHYQLETNRLEVIFRHDLEEQFEVEDNPKRTLLFNIAWDYGHSAGYQEVVGYYSELVDLIK